jgi:hypothetical protein
MMVNFRRGNSNEPNDEFMRLLAEYNKDQRIKTQDEILREIVATIDKPKAYERLITHRTRKRRIKMEPMEIGEGRARSEISEAKMPFLKAVKRILEQMEQEDFLPVMRRLIGLTRMR